MCECVCGSKQRWIGCRGRLDPWRTCPWPLSTSPAPVRRSTISPAPSLTGPLPHTRSWYPSPTASPSSLVTTPSGRLPLYNFWTETTSNPYGTNSGSCLLGVWTYRFLALQFLCLPRLCFVKYFASTPLTWPTLLYRTAPPPLQCGKVTLPHCSPHYKTY